MIGTGGVLRRHPCGDGLLVAPRDDCVDEPVATAAVEIGLSEPEA